jgi:hypothetical protein
MAEGVGFEPTVRLPVRLISSQVPSTNSATLPLRLNQGREDSVNCRLVDDLVIGSGSKRSLLTLHLWNARKAEDALCGRGKAGRFAD